MTAMTPSRARAREADAKVLEVMNLKASGKWVDGASHHELAEKHGVTIEAVQKWANDAGRFLRILASVDADDLRARNAAQLQRIVSMALEKTAVVRGKDVDDVVPQPDLKAAVAAIAEQGKLLGLNAPEKVQHTVTTAYEAMSDEARLAWLDRHIAELQEERAVVVARLRLVESSG